LKDETDISQKAEYNLKRQNEEAQATQKF